jgi:AmmeMemoRadiSam system protein A
MMSALRPHAETLLQVARASIESGVRAGRALEVVPSEFAAPLRAVRASFVTLHVAGRLQGCVGSIEARRALVADVAANAYGAALLDPRSTPLRVEQIGELDVHISVLSPLEPLEVDSEASLIASLRPKLDGLVVREGERLGTFLPAVWESLPDPRAFVEEVKRKAGLPADYWSGSLRFFRYTAESLP